MEEAKFNNLCSHYKDSFDIHRATIKKRDMLFYGLLVIFAVFTLQLSSTDTVAVIVNEYMEKVSGVKIENNIYFISTLMWLLLLGFSTRYFQVVLEVEGQYIYLHSLEEQLNKHYPDSVAFTREGKSYLNNYPMFFNWIWIFYTFFFPLTILIAIFLKIKNDITIVNSIGVNQIVYFLCYLFIGTSTILYTYKLHESRIEKFFRSLSESWKHRR